jgi:hypothetical protein
MNLGRVMEWIVTHVLLWVAVGIGRLYEGEEEEERGPGKIWLQRSVMTVHCVRSRKYYM